MKNLLKIAGVSIVGVVALIGIGVTATSLCNKSKEKKNTEADSVDDNLKEAAGEEKEPKEPEEQPAEEEELEEDND